VLPQQVKIDGSQWGSAPVVQHWVVGGQAKRPQQKIGGGGAQKLGTAVVQHWSPGGHAWFPQHA
jgi:hypothetical protein